MRVPPARALQSLLLNHIDQVHRYRYEYRCQWLDCTFSSEFRSSLRRHMWDHRAVFGSTLRFSALYANDADGEAAHQRARRASAPGATVEYAPVPWLSKLQ